MPLNKKKLLLIHHAISLFFINIAVIILQTEKKYLNYARVLAVTYFKYTIRISYHRTVLNNPPTLR